MTSSVRSPSTPARHTSWSGRAVMAVAVAGMITGLMVTPARAQDLDDRKAQLQDSRDATERQLDAATADLDDIRDRIATLHDRLEEAANRLDLLNQEVETLADEVATAHDEMFRLQGRIDGARTALRSKARSVYMHGQPDAMMELLTGSDVDTAVQRARIVNRLAKQDRATVETAAAARVRMESAVDEVHVVQAALVERTQRGLDLQASMEADLAEANALREELDTRVDQLDAREVELATEIEAVEESLVQRDTGSQSAAVGLAGPGGRACPMHSIPQLFNDWGWPRGGGSRSHQGNDLYGDYREPVYAMASGVWDVQSYGNSAGNWAILKGDDGISYWYMHLDSHVVADGTRVEVGQQVAHNGWSGNAVGSVYHIHFEIHPGGGGAVDPYPYLAEVC